MLKPIVVMELTSAVFIGIALLGQFSRQDRSKSTKWLKITLLFVMIHLISDAAAYTLTDSSYPFVLRYTVNFLAYVMAPADLFAFIKYYEAYISYKTVPGKWRFRIPLTATVIYGAAISVMFIAGRLIVYENGIVAAIYDIPLLMRVLCILIMLYTPSIALHFRKAIGMKATFLLGIYCLSPVFSILAAIFTQEEFSIVIGAIAVELVSILLQTDERQRLILENIEHERTRKEQIAMMAGGVSAYIVNPATNRLQIISRNSHLTEDHDSSEDFNTFFSGYIENDVFEPDRKAVSEKINVPAMVRGLEQEDEYLVRFRDISAGHPRWYEMRAVKLSDDEILYGFADKDDEIITQLMSDNFKESYFGLYYINLDSGLAQIVRTGHPEITGPIGQYIPYTELMINISSASSGESAKFFSKISDIDYIIKRFADEDLAYHVFKSYIFEGSRWVNYTGRVLQRHDDGTPSIFALAFSLLDEEACEKEEANLKLQAALEKAEAANKARTSFVNSFKALYQVMYYIDLKKCKTDFLYGDEDAGKFIPIFNTDSIEKIFRNFKTDYIDSVVVPDDRDRVLGIMNAPNIFRTLRTDSSMSVNYRVRRNLIDPVYTEMSVIKAEEENGELTAIIIAFRMTGEELRTALETQKKMEADARIISALSEDFGCVDYVELADTKENDRSVGVRVSDTMRKLLPEWELTGTFSAKMELFCKGLVYEPDRELFHQANSRETVLEKLSRSDSYYFNTRLLISGEVRYYQTKMSAVRADGKLIGIVSGIRSVDEYTKKELENQRQLQKALDDAKAANEAKTNFLFNMSHDIRTPMNAVTGFTTMAKKYIDDPEKAADYLDKIDVSGQQLLSLINQVLEMARIESGKIELNCRPIDIKEEFDSLAMVLSEQAKSNDIHFVYSLRNIRHFRVLSDEARLGQITLNIAGNAIKYTPAGGMIDFSLTEIPCDREGHARYVFTCKDTGIGMSEEYQKKIFQPFERENNSTVSHIQGTGLGLSIVKNLVDLLGGSIAVESTQGEGTRFDITLDFKIDDRKSDADIPTEEVDISKFAGRRVLLVEDNEMNREIAGDILEEYGFIIDEAEDGDIAVNKVKACYDAENHSYYDFILMDIQMPRMNGYEAAKAIRDLSRKYARIPIIALTANAFEEDRQNALAAGMDDHLAKPIDVRKLFKTIAKFLK